jgi:hypothetical protein
MMTGPKDSNPRELPDVRDRRLPYDYDDDGVAGYLPELRDRGARHDDEDEDEAGL